MLEIKKLNKKLSNKWILKDIDLTFSNGVYGLLGANGAGKTTLIRCLCKLYGLDSGKILWNGETLKKLGNQYFLDLGYLPQNFGYYSDFTAYDFLLYIATLKGIKKENSNERINDLLKKMNLYEDRNKKLKQYSGGMLRRVGIAQALLNEPQILILDEPTAGLDPKERIHLKNLLSRYGENHIVLISTHIVSDIEDIAKKVIVLKEGKICAQGSVEDLLHTINDFVYEGEISKSELMKVMDLYPVRNIYEKKDTVKVKIISDHLNDERFLRIEPTLNDLYLYYFNEEKENENIDKK